jgi:YHS domain-containing protein
MIFLLRLIMFMIAISVAISVIRSAVIFVQRLWAGTQQQRTVRHAPASAAGSATMLQQDPVCGTYVAVDSSLKRIVGGRVIHFCSAECRDRFPG